MMSRLHRMLLHWFAIALILWFPGLSISFGQSARIPLPVEQHAPVLDQFRLPLAREGNYLVHVLSAGDAIRAPDVDTGAPHPSNTVLFTTRIGAGIDPSTHGGFIASLIPRPSQPFFIRVYNASSPTAATFYEDSAPYYPSDSLDAGFVPALLATTNPINPDVTVDGMTVSMKRSLGLNPNLVDTDGDGYSDLDELAMGTSATDAGEFVPALEVAINAAGVISAGWAGGGVPHQHVLEVLGIPAHTPDQLNQVFRDKNFKLQSSSGPHGAWTSAIQGQIGRAGWPPSLSMRDATNRTGIFRLMVQP